MNEERKPLELMDDIEFENWQKDVFRHISPRIRPDIEELLLTVSSLKKQLKESKKDETEVSDERKII